MAINPNTAFSAGAVLTADQMNRLPRGIMNTATSTSTQSIGGGSYQDITSLSCSVTFVANRAYNIYVTLNQGPPGTATAGLTYQVLDGSTVVGIQAWNIRSDVGYGGLSFNGVFYYVPSTSGSRTVKVQGQAYAQAASLINLTGGHRLTIVDLGAT